MEAPWEGNCKQILADWFGNGKGSAFIITFPGSYPLLKYCISAIIILSSSLISCFLHFQLVITDTNISLFKLIPSKSKFHIFLFSTCIALPTMEKLAQNGKIFFALCSKARIKNTPNPLISVLLVLKQCHRYELLHQYCVSRQGTMADHVRQTTRQGKVKNTTWNYIAMEMLLQPPCWFCPKTMPYVPCWAESSSFLLLAYSCKNPCVTCEMLTQPLCTARNCHAQAELCYSILVWER